MLANFVPKRPLNPPPGAHYYYWRMCKYLHASNVVILYYYDGAFRANRLLVEAVFLVV